MTYCRQCYSKISIEEAEECNGYCEKCYKNPNKSINEKKNKFLIWGIIAGLITIITIIIYIFIINNNDLNKINEEIINYNWISVKQILDKHEDNQDFINKAYANIISFLEEKQNDIKAGEQNEKIYEFIMLIEKDIPQRYQTKIEEIKENCNTYLTYNNLDDKILENGYIWAFTFLQDTKKEYSSDEEFSNKLQEKKVEIIDKTLEEAKIKAQEKMDEENYQEVINILMDFQLYNYTIYKNENTEIISNMYNSALNKLIAINKEKESQNQAEKEAKEQAELEARKDKITIDSNGKKIWKVCMSSDTFRFEANYNGTGNFIVKLLNSNQELEKVICNEIGD